MAVSSTTFAERLARIEAGNTIHAVSIADHTKASRKPAYRARSTFGIIAGVAILTVGAGYVWFMAQGEIQWSLALAY